MDSKKFMDRKKFLSLMKKGKLSKAEVIERLLVGDIYQTDIKGDAKQYMNIEMYNMMQKVYDKKQFVKWLATHSKKLDDKKCPSKVKEAIDNKIISIFDKEIMDKLPGKCVELLVKSETTFPKAIPRQTKQTIKKPETIEKTDEYLLNFIRKLDKDANSGTLVKDFKKLGIETRRIGKKGTMLASIKKSIKPKKSKLLDEPKIVSKKDGKAPSEFKIMMSMRNLKIDDSKVQKFFEKLVDQIKTKNTGLASNVSSKSSTSSNGSSSKVSSTSSNGSSSKVSSTSSKVSNGSSKSSTSPGGSNKIKMSKIRKAKTADLKLVAIPRRKRSRSRSSENGDDIVRRLPVFNNPGMIAFTKRMKRN